MKGHSPAGRSAGWGLAGLGGADGARHSLLQSTRSIRSFLHSRPCLWLQRRQGRSGAHVCLVSMVAAEWVFRAHGASAGRAAEPGPGAAQQGPQPACEGGREAGELVGPHTRPEPHPECSRSPRTPLGSNVHPFPLGGRKPREEGASLGSAGQARGRPEVRGEGGLVTWLRCRREVTSSHRGSQQGADWLNGESARCSRTF